MPLQEITFAYVKDESSVLVIKLPVDRAVDIERKTAWMVYGEGRKGKVDKNALVKRLRAEYEKDEEFFFAVRVALKLINHWGFGNG